MKIIHIFVSLLLMGTCHSFTLRGEENFSHGNWQEVGMSVCVNGGDTLKYQISFYEHGNPKLAVFEENQFKKVQNQECDQRNSKALKTINLKVDEDYCNYAENDKKVVVCSFSVEIPSEVKNKYVSSIFTNCEGVEDNKKCLYMVDVQNVDVSQTKCKLNKKNN